MGKIKNYLLNSFKNSTKTNYLKTIGELSKTTGIESEKVEKIIKINYKIFCRNSKGEITTRELYKKYTRPLRKFASVLEGRIL